jgi:epoxyqueuosine reductase
MMADDSKKTCTATKSSSVSSNESNDTLQNSGTSRRNFLKFGAIGAGAAAAGVVGTTIVRRMDGIPQDSLPIQINDNFKPIDQRNVIHTFAYSKALNKKHPERIKKFDDFKFYELYKNFYKGPYRNTPGYTQLDRALLAGGGGLLGKLHGKHGLNNPDGYLSSWKQDMVAPNKYTFTSKQEAAQSIKSAAKCYGAIKCGITRRDRRFDFDPLYNIGEERVMTWENDFPFVPKTVIVLMVEMDYLAMSTAPTWIADATVGNAYVDALKIASQTAIFLQQLGYKAVATMNDMGMNVPYAIAAGLGEGGRNGQVITPGYGPRVRISKVYTDFDFVEYDKPVKLGVANFCLQCKRCAESCPSEAITFDGPSWEPEYSDDPEYIWHASKGVYKFHNDAKKCFKFWIENDGGCGNCITSCPYNKPDFSHHRFVDIMNVIAPSQVHGFMKEMDILFGYGAVSDPAAVKKFWKRGRTKT